MADVSPARAAGAYQNNLRMLSMPGDDLPGDQASAPSFYSMLGNAIDSVAHTGHKAEALEMQSVTGGKVDLTDLVTAVADAQLTLSTVVALRDRIISAYQSIIAMPI